MNDIIKILGGLCVIILLFLIIGAIWFDTIFMLKLIGTDLIFITFLYILDHVTDDIL